MALNLGELYVQINARTGGLVRGGKDVNRFVNRSSAGFSRVAKAATRMGAALGLAVGVESIRRAVLLADEYKVLENRIRTATARTGDFAKVNAEVFAIAQRSGVALKTQVTLFQSLARAADDLGATNDDILKVTETLSQLGVIGGSSQEELNNGLRQLSQAFAGGVLRAEEFNSVLENIPEVGNVLAEQLGLSIGEFRKAVNAGEITSEALFAALQGAADQTQARFDELPATLGQAITRLTNSWGKFLLQVDKALGVTQGLAKILTSISEFITGDFGPGLVIVKEVFMGVWEIAKALFDVIVAVGKILLVPLRSLFKIQGTTGGIRDTFQLVVGAIKIVSMVLVGVLGILEKVGTAIYDFFLAPFVRIADELKQLFLDIGGFILNFFLDLYEKIAGLLQNIPFLKGVGEGLEGSIANIRAEIAAIQDRRAAIDEDHAAAAALVEKQKELEAQRLANEAAAAAARAKAEKEAQVGTIRNLGAFNDAKYANERQALQKQLGQAASYSKEFFALNKAASLAQAIINGYKSAVSSFAFGSEIGGPVVGGIFAGIAVAATLAQINQIRSTSFAGGRASGGGVSANRMYRVNENGPELLSTGGKDYLMMGSNRGQVTSNRDMRGGGGAGNVYVTVNNSRAATKVDVESRQNGNDTIVNLIVEKAERRVSSGIRSGNSAVATAIENTYGVDRAAGAR